MKKMNYEAPKAEVVELNVNKNIMSFGGGGILSGGTSGINP